MVSKQFVLAGDAIFTIETPEGHRTYHVQKVDGNAHYGEAWFVRLLTGPDNTNSYTYLGKMDSWTGQTGVTKKSRLPQDSYPIRLLNRVLARVWVGDHAAYEQHGYKTHHEGHCGRCGRRLTVPESIESGIGPECSRQMGIVKSKSKARTLPSRQEPAIRDNLAQEFEAKRQQILTNAR